MKIIVCINECGFICGHTVPSWREAKAMIRRAGWEGLQAWAIRRAGRCRRSGYYR
jgi:hypothetical protein